MAYGLNKTAEIDLPVTQSSLPRTWPPHFLNFLQAFHLSCSLLITPLSFKDQPQQVTHKLEPQLQGASFTPSPLSFLLEIGGGQLDVGSVDIPAKCPFTPAEAHCPSSYTYPLCMCLASRLCLPLPSCLGLLIPLAKIEWSGEVWR